MLESGSSGSVRGVLSNEHPYRDPRPIADMDGLAGDVHFRVQNGSRIWGSVTSGFTRRRRAFARSSAYNQHWNFCVRQYLVCHAAKYNCG